MRCLPIFLSGCTEFVVLCGKTYLRRLWCIIELFTFVHMGLDVERIKFHLLRGERDAEEDRSSLLSSLQDFDVRRCKCFDSSDKESMHNAIYAVFGNMDNFNNVVLQVLQTAEVPGHTSAT